MGGYAIRKILCILVFMAVLKLAAQTDSFTKGYFNSYPQTAKTALQAPIGWDNDSWYKLGGIIFIGSSLYLFDEEIANLVQNNRNDFTKDVATAANYFGEGKYVLPAIGLTWLGGYVFDSPKTQVTALLAVKSFLLANGVSLSLKFLTQRQRPFRKQGKQFWNGQGFDTKRESFPSGHTTIVWSLAPILAEQYKETKWVPSTAYSIAILTSYARMHNDRHWSSDVFAGAVIGYVTSQLVLKTTPRLEIAPSLEPQGINLGYKF